MLLFRNNTAPVRPDLSIVVDGVERRRSVIMASVRIIDDYNEQPNTAYFECFDFTPTIGLHVNIRSYVSGAFSRKEFSGTITRRQKQHREQGVELIWACECIDGTYEASGVLITKAYGALPAYDIARDLMLFAPSGFTANNVTVSLPTVDAIQFKMTPLPDALTQLARACGADWYFDEDNDLHFYLTDASETPTAISTANRVREFRWDELSDVLVNRVVVEGDGTSVLGSVNAGDTSVPVDSVAKFSSEGGEFITGNQRGSYAATVEGGTGSLVGTGTSPDGAPSAALASGGSVDSGAHSYGYTWVTAAGETPASPTVSATTGVATDPAAGPSIAADLTTWSTQAGLAVGDTVQVGVQFANDSGFSIGVTNVVNGGSLTVPEWNGGAGHQALITYSLSGSRPTFARYAKVFFKKNGGAYQANGNAENLGTGSSFSVTGSIFDSFGAASGGASTTVKTVSLAGIAPGPTNTTSRKVYRTIAGGSSLLLLTTIADNTTTTYSDSTADGSLGAAAPTGDTSGLVGAQKKHSFHTEVAGFRTDGAATTATGTPVFSTASYTFVAGDVGAYVYIKSGVNWIAGFYTIVSVAAGAATLDRACASVASPTSATWGVDYSRMTAARFNFTDIVIDPAVTTRFTSAANPNANANMVGNTINLSGNVLGFTDQQVIVSFVSGGSLQIVNCDKSLGVVSSTGGIASLGGTSSASVAAGATSMPLASTGFASSSGGWALCNRQVIRFTGKSATALTGIPSSGAGAITAAIAYGSTVTVTPQLTGVPASGTRALGAALAIGDEINILVIAEDTSSQSTYHVTREKYIQDRRLSLVGAATRAQAELVIGMQARVSGSYITTDAKSRSGRLISIDMLTDWSIDASYTITRVEKYMEGPTLQRRVSFSSASIDRNLFQFMRGLQRSIRDAA